MRSLRFETLTLKNFKAVRSLQFRLSEYPTGLLFVAGKNQAEARLGSNGAGKSTLWDALCWVLFGGGANGLRTVDLRPWSNPSRTVVTLDFLVGNETHAITRGTSPTSLTLDGHDCDQGAIDRLLGGLTYDLFLHSVLFAQHQPLLTDLPPREQLDLFSAMLDLDRWERRSLQAATRAGEVSDRALRVETEMMARAARLEHVASTLAHMMTQSEAWEQIQAERRRVMQERRAELETRRGALQRQRDENNLALDSAATEYQALEREIHQLQEYKRQAESALRASEGHLRLAQEMRDRAQAELLAMQQARDCPTCGQALPARQRAAAAADIKSRLVGHKRDYRTFSRISENETRVVVDLDRQLVAATTSLAEFRSRAATARGNLDSIDPELSEVVANLAVLVEAPEANPFASHLAQLRRERRELRAKIDEDEERIAKLRRIHARTSFWIKGFREVRLYVLQELLSDLEFAANELVEEFGLAGWQVAYKIDRETNSGTTVRGLQMMITSPRNTNPVRFASWSGGEAQRLRLACSLALAQMVRDHVGIDLPLLVLDEPTRHLDRAGVDDLLEVLASYAGRQQRQVWITDHRSLESRHFAGRLTVVRNSDGITLQ